MRVSLVTLSACETGLTDIAQSPDEYVGLPAGFLQAGTPAVVSSLWAVDDCATSMLMERFYKCHLERDMPPAQALRHAQLWLRDLPAEEAEALISENAALATLKVRRPEPYQPDAPSSIGTMHFGYPFYWGGFTFMGA